MRTPEDSKQEDDRHALDERLAKLSAALRSSPLAATTRPEPASRERKRGARAVPAGGLALSLGLLAVAIATGNLLWAIAAAILGVFSTLALLGGALGRLPLPPELGGARDPNRAHIGLGAEVAADAIIEPGATVEMGATVRSKAVIKRGAVVRMGATIEAGAVLEEGAVVSWGADVLAGAVLERDAAIGAGATVAADTRVPRGTRLAPGADWTAARSHAAGVQTVGATPTNAPKDPRRERLDAACDRIETELRQTSPQLREALGVTDRTASSLRTMCEGVIARERLLRAEAAPDTLSLLNEEKTVLDRRIAEASDPAIRRSLERAVEAISDQQRQRTSLLQRADRLDAELTRLQWTLEGMGTQLVRLRTTGLEARAPEAELLGAFGQLYEEVGAIADGLEEVTAMDERVAPVSPIDSGETLAPVRTRQRD